MVSLFHTADRDMIAGVRIPLLGLLSKKQGSTQDVWPQKNDD